MILAFNQPVCPSSGLCGQSSWTTSMDLELKLVTIGLAMYAWELYGVFFIFSVASWISYTCSMVLELKALLQVL